MSAYALEQDFDNRLRFTDVSSHSTSSQYPAAVPNAGLNYGSKNKTSVPGIPANSGDYEDHSTYVKSQSNVRPILNERSHDPHQSHDSLSNSPLRSYDSSVRSHESALRAQNSPQRSYDSSLRSQQSPVRGVENSYSSYGSPRRTDRYEQSVYTYQDHSPDESSFPQYTSVNSPTENMSSNITAVRSPGSQNERFEVRVTPISSPGKMTSPSKPLFRAPPPPSPEPPSSPYRNYPVNTATYSNPDRSPSYQFNISTGGGSGRENSFPNYTFTTDGPQHGTEAHNYSTRDQQQISPVGYNAGGYSNQYPEAAQSRLVHTAPTRTYGYAQSRPMNDLPSPGSPQINYSKPSFRTEMPPNAMMNSPSPPPPPLPPPISNHQPSSPPTQQHESYQQPQHHILYGSKLASPQQNTNTTGNSNENPNRDLHYQQQQQRQQYPTQPQQQRQPATQGGRIGQREQENGPPGGGKEAEVDALTNLLMQNMEAAADPDFFGMCAKCARAIMGEEGGCKALDQLFHVDCFTCISCSSHLKGRPFYAMEGRPYCEPCYINTLEKCSVCMEPITDRIVRATGKPYHSKCFVCVVCSKNLEGIPFTVDSSSQIHCIEDFHRKFAPRCCVCELPIMPRSGEEEAVRIVALDRSFHMECYKCEDCGLVLSSEADGRGCYPLDDHILCKGCNARRIQQLTTKMTTEL